MMHMINHGVRADLHESDARSLAFKEQPVAKGDSAFPQASATLDAVNFQRGMRRVALKQPDFARRNPPDRLWQGGIRLSKTRGYLVIPS